ncbi:hypothetical protein BDZ94DRAFT_617638, partial [Collybia nuda]
SASAAGTIILQGFEPSIITRGCSGYLRQEFREHELLDDITRLKYEGLLPKNIEGNLRNSLIRQYQNWKGTAYVPDRVDIALKWSANDPMDILPVVNDSPWQVLSKDTNKTQQNPKATSTFIPATGSISVSNKRKFDENNDQVSPRKKKPVQTTQAPLGLTWDGDNYSCSYDSLFSILYDIWQGNPEKWTESFQNINNIYLGVLAEGFLEVQTGKSLENVRDNVRQLLHNSHPDMFPLGHEGASVGQLAFKLLRPEDINATSQIICSECNHEGIEVDETCAYAIHAVDSTPTSTKEWITSFKYPVAHTCPECLSPMVKQMQYNSVPKILVLEYPHTDIETSHKIKFTANGKSTMLYLRGIVYHGDNHFTSRIISSKGKMWYYDGMLSEQISIENKSLRDTNNNDLIYYQSKDLVLAIYAQK